MSNKKDLSIKSQCTSKTSMIMTQAQGHDGTVYIMKTETFALLRIINIKRDGSKCEFIASEWDLRAARQALNLFAEADSWDSQ